MTVIIELLSPTSAATGLEGQTISSEVISPQSLGLGQ